MGIGFTCDRCEDAFSGEPEKIIRHGEYVEMRPGKPVGDELCENCADKLEDFLDGRELKTQLMFGGDEPIGIATGGGASTESFSYDQPDSIGVSLTIKPDPYNEKSPSLPDFMKNGAKNY